MKEAKIEIPFEYSRNWYETIYHGKRKKSAEPHVEGFVYLERDSACLKDLDPKPEDRILVCGSSGGNNAILLTEKFGCHNVWGIDWSQPAVDFFNSYFHDGYRLDGLLTGKKSEGKDIRANCSQMPFDDNSFDTLLAMDITEHLPGGVYLLFLANCYRVLKYGGRIAMLPGTTHRKEHINLISIELIVGHMQRVGFHIVTQNDLWAIGQKNTHSVYKQE